MVKLYKIATVTPTALAYNDAFDAKYESSEQMPNLRSARIAQLRAQIEAGTYQVDSLALAHTMLARPCSLLHLAEHDDETQDHQK